MARSVVFTSVRRRSDCRRLIYDVSAAAVRFGSTRDFAGGPIAKNRPATLSATSWLLNGRRIQSCSRGRRRSSIEAEPARCIRRWPPANRWSWFIRLRSVRQRHRVEAGAWPRHLSQKLLALRLRQTWKLVGHSDLLDGPTSWVLLFVPKTARRGGEALEPRLRRYAPSRISSRSRSLIRSPATAETDGRRRGACRRPAPRHRRRTTSARQGN